MSFPIPKNGQHMAIRHRSPVSSLRESVLEAIHYAAIRLFSTNQWEAEIDGLLAKLGEATGVCHVALCENFFSVRGALSLRRSHAWWRQKREGADCPVCASYESYRESRLEERLRGGEVVQVNLSELPAEQRERLNELGCRSLIMAPIFSGQSWWGLLLLGETRIDRRWSLQEKRALEIAAQFLGAAILRQQEERALQEWQSECGVLLQSSPVGTFILDLLGNIESVNPVGARIVRQPQEKLIGTNVFDLMPEDLARVRRNVFDEVISSGLPAHFMETQWNQLLETRLEPVFDSEGFVCQVAVFCQDITEAKRNQRLAAVGMTASAVAHNLKNIKTCLMGSIQLMDRAVEARSVEQVEEIWPVFRRSSQRLERVIQNLLTMAREREVRADRINIPCMIRHLIEENVDWCLENKCAVYADIEEGLPEVVADPVVLHDILMNLISNAVDALGTVEGGTLRLRALRQDRDLVIEVVDDGPGIPQEIRDRVFEPFFSTKGEKGTGLGLSAVRQSVEEFGWRLELVTNFNEGACFRILIPTG